MNFPRILEVELLDHMLPGDPRAVRARRDLRRVNAIMGHTGIWKRLLGKYELRDHPPRCLVELGAGDATLLARLAPALARRWRGMKVHLVDLHPAVSSGTLDSFADLGWEAEVIEADVMKWVRDMPSADIVVANLFLHHFNVVQLQRLFAHIAVKSTFFAACEPRRSRIALSGSRLLGLAGCGPVARYDAVVSVRAGFAGTELSRLWPGGSGWRLHEKESGLFSHSFLASRSGMRGEESPT